MNIYKLKRPIFLIALFCLATTFSCQKENKVNSQLAYISSDESIANAKTWYEQTYATSSNVSNLSTSSIEKGHFDYSTIIKPDWGKALQYSGFDKNVIEIPIDNPNRFSPNVRESTSVTQKSAFTKSSFLLLKENGKYTAFVMTIVADSTYRQKGIERFGLNNYSQKDKEFSGSLVLFTPRGEFVFGWIYKNGAVVAAIIKGEKAPSIKTNLVQVPGSGGGPIVDVTHCTDFFVDVYVDNVLVYSEYVGTSCSTSSTSPNNGGGTAPIGGGTADHQVNKNKLPAKNNVDRQIGAMCTFKTLEWVSVFFDGYIDAAKSLLWYSLTKNLDGAGMTNVLEKDGIPPADLPLLINNYFVSNEINFSAIPGSINRGHPMMGTLQLPTSAHEVMITGYNNSGTIEYFDPQTGNYAIAQPNSFIKIFEILGWKPQNVN